MDVDRLVLGQLDYGITASKAEQSDMEEGYKRVLRIAISIPLNLRSGEIAQIA